MDQPEHRSLTVEWSATSAEVRAGAGALTGLDYWLKMISGEIPLPAMAAVMGIRPVHAETGRVVFEGLPGERHYNGVAGVHAAFAMALIDSAAGAAVHSQLPSGVGYTTLETKVHLVRGIRVDAAPVRCEGIVVHAGRQVATAEARVTGAEDRRLYAHGTSTCLLLPQQ